MHVHFAIKDLTFFRSESAIEVNEYIRHRERESIAERLQGQASTSGEERNEAPANKGNGRETPHALDAVSYDGSGGLSDENSDEESTEYEDEDSSESDEEEEGEEGIFNNELVIDEDLHKRLCKYLNIATDELEIEKNKTEFTNRGNKEMTVSVRLSPS